MIRKNGVFYNADDIYTEKNGNFNGKIKRNHIALKKTFIIFMALSMACITGCGTPSSELKEKAMVKKGYEAIKDSLLDPESMIVYDCYGWTAKSVAQEEAEDVAKKDDEDAELPDDLYSVFYHVGARNKLGGMADAQYLILFDLETGIYMGSGEKEEVYEAVQAHLDGDESVVIDRNVQMEYLNVEVWQMMGWPERAEDYKDFIESAEFENVNVKKILGE